MGGISGFLGELGASQRKRPIALLPRFPAFRDIWWLSQACFGGVLALGLAVAVAMSAAADVVPGAGDRVIRGFIAGSVVGGAFGLVTGLVVGIGTLWLTPIAGSPSETAVSNYRADFRSCVVAGLLTGLVGGLAAGLAAAIKFGIIFGLEAAVVFGLGAGLTILLAASRAPLVKITEFLLVIQGRGRVRFISLLEQSVSR
jgi:hypothetical protein